MRKKRKDREKKRGQGNWTKGKGRKGEKIKRKEKQKRNERKRNGKGRKWEIIEGKERKKKGRGRKERKKSQPLTKSHCWLTAPWRWQLHSEHPTPLEWLKVFSLHLWHVNPMTLGWHAHWPVTLLQGTSDLVPLLLHSQPTERNRGWKNGRYYGS